MVSRNRVSMTFAAGQRSEMSNMNIIGRCPFQGAV